MELESHEPADRNAGLTMHQSIAFLAFIFKKNSNDSAVNVTSCEKKKFS